MSFLKSVWRRAERVAYATYVNDRALRDIATGDIDLDRRGALFFYEMRSFYRRLDAYNETAPKPCKLSLHLKPEFEKDVLSIATRSFKEEPRLIHDVVGMGLKTPNGEMLDMSWHLDKLSFFSVRTGKKQSAFWSTAPASGNTDFEKFADTILWQTHAVPLALRLSRQGAFLPS